MNSKNKKRSRKEIFDDLERVANSIPAPLWWLDVNGINLGLNDATCRALGGLEVREKIVGKSHEEYYPKQIAKILDENNRKVIETGKTVEFEEAIVNILTGNPMYYTSIRSPWCDDDGNIIGIIGTSIDITAKKEAARLTLENQNQKIEYQQKLISLAHTVAHDISSPLSALNMMMYGCDELPESKRTVLKRAIESILDIANNLLSTYRNEEQQTALETEQRQPILISDLIAQLLSEKKAQYSNHSVHFETNIENNAQFAFAQLQASQFRRAISNVINNAVDALDQKNDGLVTLKLTADTESITVTLQDNGKGMPPSAVQKMLNRQRFTEGKEQGHGIGLQQVWDMLDHNQGVMAVDSTLDKGTVVQLTFPRIDAPSWIAQKIPLTLNSIVVVLDDEESIHGAWDTRFAQYLKLSPNLDVHHFKQGREALDFFNALNSHEKEHVVFLSDYELLRQAKNGLQIIEESGIKNTTLVTSYYTKSSIREKAALLNVKILPKQMASIVPIEVGLQV